MTAPPDDTTTDTSAIIAALRAERDAGQAREATLTKALAARNSEYGERIEHQSATIDVLKAMSASPGDRQPVFDLIARHANSLCNGAAVALFEYDGELVHYRSDTGDPLDPEARNKYLAMFPMVPARNSITCRAILEKQVIHVQDFQADPELHPAIKALGWTAQLSVPLMREGSAIGVITLVNRTGPFTDSQIALLKTFAEQAVIAISSAETYRALQGRTSDLQEALEYQTATSDVLKVISQSQLDLQPVLDTLLATAARLCGAEMAAIGRREGDGFRLVASLGLPPEFEADRRRRGAIPYTTRSVSGRAVLERRAIHVPDASAEPGYAEMSVKVGRQRTSLGVPLLREGEVIGSMLLARQRVEPFTDQQIELVSTFADQAVIAIENTRLLTEQREALERQTATAEVLAVINASPGDLAPVFDAILEKAMRLCDAAFGMFNTYDGTSFHTVVTRGVPAAFAAFRAEHPPIPGPDAPIGRALETRRPVHVLDWLEEAVYKRGTPGGRAITDLGGARTVLNVPLVKDTAVLGMISFYRQQVRPFSDKQIALLESFAAQAVIAMENARLITEQREALEQQTATADVLQVINASPGNLTPVFDTILEKAHRLCGATFGSLQLFDGEKFRAVATYGISGVWAERTRDGLPAVDNPVTEPLLDGARLVHIADMVDINHPLARVAAEATGVRTALFVPLRKDNGLIGVISALRREVRPFTEKEIALLENFAAQAVIAMENARLLNEQREALEQQTATAEVLQVINASPGDLEPVFDTILEKAILLCEASFGSLVTYDGECLEVVATRGLSTGLVEALRKRGPVRPSSSSAYDQIARGADIVHIEDIAATGNRFPSSPNIQDEGARTTLFVALRGDEALLGVFVIYRKEVRPFSDKQIALLENFAAQAVIAMENARLLGELRQRTGDLQESLEYQTATSDVLKVISRSTDLQPVLDTLVETAARLCDADMAAIGRPVGNLWQLAANFGFPPEFEEQQRVRGAYPLDPSLPTVAARAVHERRAVHIRDAAAISGYPEIFIGPGKQRTSLGVPLLREGEAIGYIALARRRVEPFSDRQIELVSTFADQAVIAIENARLLTEQREALEQQTATAEVLQVINASPGDLTLGPDAG
jgi:GAF domain-containing protein